MRVLSVVRCICVCRVRECCALCVECVSAAHACGECASAVHACGECVSAHSHDQREWAQ